MRIDREKRIIADKVTFQYSLSDPLFNEVASTEAYIQGDLWRWQCTLDWFGPKLKF
jgi:hypothetical protein